MNPSIKETETLLSEIAGAFKNILSSAEANSSTASLMALKWAVEVQADRSIRAGFERLVFDVSNDDKYFRTSLLNLLHDLNQVFEGPISGDIALQALRNERVPIGILRKAIRLLHESSLKQIGQTALARLFQQLRQSSVTQPDQLETPTSLRELTIQLLDPKPGMKIHDLTCSGGSWLLGAGVHTRDIDGGLSMTHLSGQELNPARADDARVSLKIAGFDTDVRAGDTLLAPQHQRGGKLDLFDRVFSHPPFGSNWEPNIKLNSDPFGRFTSRTMMRCSANLAFVLHALAVLNVKGRAVILNPINSLSHSGSDRSIRQHLVDADHLEQVIQLPANLFQGTDVQPCVLVLSKAKPKHLLNRVLFLDMSRDFDGPKTQRHLTKQGIQRALVASSGPSTPSYSAIVSRDQIAAKDYDLSGRLYLESSHWTGESFEAEVAKLARMMSERDRVEAQFKSLLKQLPPSVQTSPHD